MCGIVGYFGLELSDADSTSLLTTMSDAVVHRGPDDHGTFADELVGLAMRQLSIDPLHQTRFVLSQDSLVKDLQMKADEMFMATSLEMRTPILNHRLVEWAARQLAQIIFGSNQNGIHDHFDSKQVPQILEIWMRG